MTAAAPATTMSGRYQRAFTVAVVFLVAGWHLVGAGGQLLHNRQDYASFAFQGAMWLVMALAITAGSILVMRGTPSWRAAWAVAVVALAASTAAAAASPAGEMLAVNWAWGSAGWTGVLVLLRRRFAELAWFLAAEALATLGVQVWDGLTRTDLAGFLAVLAWSTGAQVAVAAGVRALDLAAGQAATAVRSEHAARERAAGLNEVLEAAGVPFADGGVLYGEWSEQWGRVATGQLLDRCPDTDAIFCGSDQIARGAGDALRSAGRRVPDDIALVGFDNWNPMVRGSDPPLSSVDMCLEDVGRAAAEDLLAAIGGEPARGVRTVPCRLVVRESSAPSTVKAGDPGHNR